MRLAVATLILAAAVQVPLHPGASEVGSHGGGAIVGGAPVAIAVTAPAGAVASWQRRGGGSGPRWTCAYHRLENGSSSGSSIAIDFGGGPQQPVAGQIYALVCWNEQHDVVHSWFGAYDPGDPFAGLFAGERAAELALERLDVPDPVVRLNPPDDQLVGLQSWLWVDTPWAPVEASAGVTGVTATVTARPQSVAWDLGDGEELRCDGPGVPYDPLLAPDAPGACTHVFDRSSADAPGGVRRVTATVVYAVSWHATDGGVGDLGTVSRATTVPTRVVEVQAVID